MLASRLRYYGSRSTEAVFDSIDQLCYHQLDGPPLGFCGARCYRLFQPWIDEMEECVSDRGVDYERLEWTGEEASDDSRRKLRAVRLFVGVGRAIGRLLLLRRWVALSDNERVDSDGDDQLGGSTWAVALANTTTVVPVCVDECEEMRNHLDHAAPAPEAEMEVVQLGVGTEADEMALSEGNKNATHVEVAELDVLASEVSLHVQDSACIRASDVGGSQKTKKANKGGGPVFWRTVGPGAVGCSTTSFVLPPFCSF